MDSRQVSLARFPGDIREMLHRRFKAGIDTGLVTPRIDAVPAPSRQVHGIETVEGERPVDRINGEALVDEAGRDTICPEEGSEQMAPGIAEPGAVPEDPGCAGLPGSPKNQHCAGFHCG